MHLKLRNQLKDGFDFCLKFCVTDATILKTFYVVKLFDIYLNLKTLITFRLIYSIF